MSNRWVVAWTTLYSLHRDESNTTIMCRRTRIVIAYAKRFMPLKRVRRRIFFLSDSVLGCTPGRRRRRIGRAPYCISKFEPLVVFARMAPLLIFWQLQFFARTEVMEASPLNNREIIFHYFFFTVFYWLFLLYLPIAEKVLVLFPSNLRTHEMRQVLDTCKMVKVVVVWIL